MEPIEGEVVAVQTGILDTGGREVIITIRVVEHSKPHEPDSQLGVSEEKDKELQKKYVEQLTAWGKFRETILNLGVSRKVRIVLDGVKQRDW